jgi:hypothetical protein
MAELYDTLEDHHPFGTKLKFPDLVGIPRIEDLLDEA